MSAYTQADLDALDRAVLNQSLTVSIAGRSRTYRSLDELLKAREFVRQQLTQMTGRKKLLAEFSKGVQT